MVRLEVYPRHATTTTFIQPIQILSFPSSKSVLSSNLIRPAHILKYELPAQAWIHDPLTQN